MREGEQANTFKPRNRMEGAADPGEDGKRGKRERRAGRGRKGLRAETEEGREKMKKPFLFPNRFPKALSNRF